VSTAADGHNQRVTVDALIAFGALLFAQAVVRLRRRGRPDLAGWDRVALFTAALALTWVALLSPLDRIAEEKLLAGHMAQHVLIGDLVPALVLLAVRGPLVFFLLPAAVLAPLARSPLRRGLSALLRPKVAFAIWAANLAIWHIPALYDTALAHDSVHYLEHACWVFAGFLVWTLLLDERLTVGRRVALAASMFAAGTVLADVLVFSFRNLYPAYDGAYGLSAVTDQQLAGVVMMVEQVLTLGTLTAVLLLPRLRRRRLDPLPV
jgi:cytochrome c oxidase assembly factor CtaG